MWAGKKQETGAQCNHYLSVIIQWSDVDKRVDLHLRQTASESDEALLQLLQRYGTALTSLKESHEG